MKALLALMVGVALAAVSAAAQEVEPAVFREVQTPLATANLDATGPTGYSLVQYAPAVEEGVWEAGAGVYILQPRWGNNPAWAANDALATQVGGAFTTASATYQENFDYRMQAAPLVWVGYMNPNGIGLRARWWQLREGAFSAVASPAEADPTFQRTIYSAWPLGLGVGAGSRAGTDYLLQTYSRLAVDVADFEVMGEFHPGRWTLVLGGGVRYAHLAQGYAAVLTGTPLAVNGPSLLTAVNYGRNFNGAGPTLLVEARRPLGSSFLSFFTNTRGSLLVGRGTQRCAAISHAFEPGDNITYDDAAVASTLTDDVLPVAEIELGLRYERPVGYCRLFVETAFVGQAWFGAGNSANSGPITGTPFPDEALDTNSTLGLVGLKVAGGIRY